MTLMNLHDIFPFYHHVSTNILYILLYIYNIYIDINVVFSVSPAPSARPRPWPQMEYENSYVEVVTGEELPPIKLKTPKGAAELNLW